MNLFDVMGPIMVGPSSSHTAGAVRIGRIVRSLLGSQPQGAALLLHGSFAATGGGHGTDKALVAGLLGMAPDDVRIPQAFQLAGDAGMALSVSTVELRSAHPNTVLVKVMDSSGHRLEVNASSLGGGRVRVNAIDGMDAAFTGDLPTLIIRNSDRPGMVAEVATMLSEQNVNIATMQLYRDKRNGSAVMVIESDQPIHPSVISALNRQDGILRVVYLNLN